MEKIFEGLVKKMFDEIKELTNKINHDDLTPIYIRFDDFSNVIELIRKIKSSEMKLEDEKKLQNIYKSNLNDRNQQEVINKKPPKST